MLPDFPLPAPLLSSGLHRSAKATRQGPQQHGLAACGQRSGLTPDLSPACDAVVSSLHEMLPLGARNMLSCFSGNMQSSLLALLCQPPKHGSPPPARSLAPPPLVPALTVGDPAWAWGFQHPHGTSVCVDVQSPAWSSALSSVVIGHTAHPTSPQRRLGVFPDLT